MNRVFQGVLLAALGFLLAGILAALLYISFNGIHVVHSGEVFFTGMTDSLRLEMPDTVNLSMPEPAALSVTGPGGGSLPLDLSLLSCPTCGGSMIPVRWNLVTGEIEWVCPSCDDSVTSSPNRGQP